MIWTSREAQEIDRLSSQTYGIPSLSLMEEAGLAIFHLALRLWKPYSHFIILVGGGNNGGDALVVARLLFDAKFPFTCFDLAAGKESLERKTQRLALEEKTGPLTAFKGSDSLASFKAADLVVIDGLLGIGLKGALRPGPLVDCMNAVKDFNARVVLAIDLPSGLDADAWDQAKAPLPATHTITFGALKAAHVGEPSRRWCGHVTLARLGFAPEAIQSVIAQRAIEYRHEDRVPRLAELWQHLPPDAHKYDRGHVLAVGGSPGKVGAILMAAQAAQKAGAGWVSVAPLSEFMAPAWPREFTYEAFALEGTIDLSAMKEFIVQRKVRAVLLGPGTMASPLTRKVMEVLSEMQKNLGLRLIFDAGALADILDLAEGLKFDPDHTLLTPHPGEWKRLKKDLPVPGKIEDLEKVTEWVKRIGMSVIFKSASPMVISPSKVSFLTRGDNRLGRAGSGDVLAGLVLGLAATPYPLPELVAKAQIMLALSASRDASQTSESPLQLLEKII